MRDAALTNSEIAAKFDCSEGFVRKRRKEMDAEAEREVPRIGLAIANASKSLAVTDAIVWNGETRASLVATYAGLVALGAGEIAALIEDEATLPRDKAILTKLSADIMRNVAATRVDKAATAGSRSRTFVFKKTAPAEDRDSDVA